MDTDVYLVCPVCKSITEGCGSGDLTDRIDCKKCLNSFISGCSISYKKCNLDEGGSIHFNGKKLYIPRDLNII